MATRINPGQKLAETMDKLKGGALWTLDLPSRLDLPEGLHRQPP